MQNHLGATVPPTDANLNSISLEYPFDAVSKACRNFSQSCLLGKGSYGAVYKGILKDGTEVAVKALNNPKDSGFKEEVMVLSKFRHPNLVILMGFSRNGRDRYLIYELLPGGDLCSRLQRDMNFDWRKRISALLDAALGLSHLHNASPKVFHRDIKTQNILLDRNGIAKMADFGLALLCQPRKGLKVEQCSGTIGYADPLYISSSVVTEKSEVYSFGMVVLETLTGKPPAVQNPVNGQVQYVYAHFMGDVRAVMSMIQWRAGWPPELAQRMARLALACIEKTEAYRPVFIDIVGRLRDLTNRSFSQPLNVPNFGYAMQGGSPVAAVMINNAIGRRDMEGLAGNNPLIKNQLQLEEAFKKLTPLVNPVHAPAPVEKVTSGKWNPFEISDEEVPEQENVIIEPVEQEKKCEPVPETVVPDPVVDTMINKAVADFDDELRALSTSRSDEDIEKAMTTLFPSTDESEASTTSFEDTLMSRRRDVAKHLLNAGFSIEQTREALKRTTSVEAAVEWIVEQRWG
jgi:serine/threonine protein kinase